MRALSAGGAVVLVAVGLAAASGAGSSHARPVVRLAPNARESKLSGTQAAVGWAASNWSGYAAQHSSSYSGAVDLTTPSPLARAVNGPFGPSAVPVLALRSAVGRPPWITSFGSRVCGPVKRPHSRTHPVR